VRRVPLSPKWLVGHVLVLATAVLFCRLGWWQWHRSRETHGNMQYLSYAFQWPLFAGFAVLLWVRIIRDSQRPPASDQRARPRPVPVDAPQRATGADEPDDELTAYNRYLASLYERDRRERA
jgi:DNA-binding transcriptional regulator of glucitol operon